MTDATALRETYWRAERRGLILRNYRAGDIGRVEATADFAAELAAAPPLWVTAGAKPPGMAWTVASTREAPWEADRPLACAGLYPAGPRAFFLWGYCSELGRGEWGFVTACARDILGHLDRDKGVAQICAYARADRPAMRRYLQRLGFEWTDDVAGAPPMHAMIRTRSATWTR